MFKTDLPGDRFKMAVFGCRLLVLDKLKEKMTPIEIIQFAVKGASLKDHKGRVERHIKMIFSRMIYHSIKIL